MLCFSLDEIFAKDILENRFCNTIDYLLNYIFTFLALLYVRCNLVPCHLEQGSS